MDLICHKTQIINTLKYLIMKKLMTVVQALAVTMLLFSCSKATNDDISFISSAELPKDLQVEVSVTPAGIATITPSATGVAYFDIYYDISDTSIHDVVLPGKNIVHTYSEGNYTINVVAKNVTGGEASITKSITVTTSTMLVDFETPATTYGASAAFGGAAFAQITNPDPSGINTSSNAGQITKGATGALSEIWAGISINTSAPIVLSSLCKIKMKVYSDHVGANYKFKLESGSPVEADATTTVANAWEELTFQMPTSAIGSSFAGFSIFYEFGLQGDGSAPFIGLFDDVKVYP